MWNRKHFLWYYVFSSQMRHLYGPLLTIFTQSRWGVWLKFLYRFKGYYNVFCGTENIFCDITYFPHKCATFVVPFVFWFTKMLTLTIFTQNCWGVWLKCLCRFKGYFNVFCGTKNIFCDITYFPHKCATFMVPFVFWFTKMLTLTIFTQRVWLNSLCRFKDYYNVFRGTKNIFCDITYFPHKCATFVVPFVFWFTKMLTLTIVTQNRRGVWLKFLSRFKGYYNVFCGTKNISMILRIFRTNAPPLWFPSYFGLQKCWRWQLLLKIVEEYG